jgi:CBS domain-containing protein
MKVSGFMVPAEKVATCGPKDTLRMVLDEMLSKKVGCLVVVTPNIPLSIAPLGIVTKTDLVEAYKNGLTLDKNTADEVMSKDLETCVETMDRDQAAKVLERNKNHHALVINKDGDFRGLISSWDITVEVAKDSRAWPFFRTEDGRIHNDKEKKGSVVASPDLGTSPTSTVEESHINSAKRQSHLGDSFRAMIDNLEYVDM